MCKCWCGGHFHGTAGLVNREALKAIIEDHEKMEYLMSHGFIKGETKFKEQTKLDVKDIDQGKIIILPPAPGLCQECAVKHEPDMPHDFWSLYYQTKFSLENRRAPTWEDAMAHCSEETKKTWKKALADNSVTIP
jgi:hypothetical protein